MVGEGPVNAISGDTRSSSMGEGDPGELNFLVRSGAVGHQGCLQRAIGVLDHPAGWEMKAGNIEETDPTIQEGLSTVLCGGLFRGDCFRPVGGVFSDSDQVLSAVRRPTHA